MTERSRLAIIAPRRGTMYDPAVVDMFERVARDIAPLTLPEPRLEGLMQLIRGASAAAEPDVAPSSGVAAAPASSELLAFVSLARIAAGTPTLSDVGALAEGHLRLLAPGTTMALFAVDAAQAALTVRFAAGPAVDAVSPLTMRLGDRLTGWVGANLRPMRNGDGRLDIAGRDGAARPLGVGDPAGGRRRGGRSMILYSAEPLGDDQCRMLEMIGPHLAAAVASAAAAEADVPHVRAPLRVVARRLVRKGDSYLTG